MPAIGRRGFIATLGGAAASPLVAHSQGRKVYRLGILPLGLSAFQALRELDTLNGKT